jgi:hypothetical protein
MDLFQLIGSTDPNYLWDCGKIGIGAVVGSGATQFVQWMKGRNNKTLVCIGTYCPITSDQTDFTFLIKHVGTEVLEDVEMLISCGSADRIGKTCFKVDEQLLCKRINWGSHNGRKVTCTWKYINAGDVLHLVFPIRNCQNPEKVKLEIDGLATKVKRKKIVESCSTC